MTGDAAFVVRPHVSMGVTKAAADAWSLAHALEAHGEGIAGGLVAFEGRAPAQWAGGVGTRRQFSDRVSGGVRSLLRLDHCRADCAIE